MTTQISEQARHLILALCREAWSRGIDVEDAANGDVAALANLRQDC